jgi:hypothetical protein
MVLFRRELVWKHVLQCCPKENSSGLSPCSKHTVSSLHEGVAPPVVGRESVMKALTRMVISKTSSGVKSKSFLSHL